jgi:hypothetical protein
MARYLFDIDTDGLDEVVSEYDDLNWRKGIQYSRLYAAAQRHLMAFWGGQEIDPVSGRPNIYQAIATLIFMSEMPAEFDDR